MWQSEKMLVLALSVVGLHAIVTSLWKRCCSSSSSSSSSSNSTSDTSERAKLLRRRRNEKRGRSYPPFVPNGWYKLCFSSEVSCGQVIEIDAIGRVFAVFRGENGKVGVMSAYCPHLGANMTKGGCVKGNDLECPFHRWSFDIHGCVTNIPYYKDTLPTATKSVKYHFEEVYGQIFVWYHSDGIEPTWRLPAVEGIDDGSMVLRGGGPAYRQVIDMHIQEWAENGVDYAHFDVLHKKMIVPWYPWLGHIPFIEIIHVGKYVMDEENKHISYFIDNAHLQLFGKDLPITKATATIHFIGPGGCIQLWFEIPDLGKIVLFETHTPTEECVMTTDFMWYADESIPRFIVWYVIGNWFSQAQNDYEIWGNKIYLDQPILLKTDGPVAQFRRWYRQFYTAEALEEKKRIGCPASEKWDY